MAESAKAFGPPCRGLAFFSAHQNEVHAARHGTCLRSGCRLLHLPGHAQHAKLGCLSGVLSSQVHQLEFILDSLVDEKDRSTQKRGDATGGGRPEGPRNGHASTNSTSDGSSQLSLEISVTRPAEIEAALQQFVSPKVTGPYAGNRFMLSSGRSLNSANGNQSTYLFRCTAIRDCCFSSHSRSIAGPGVD